MPVLIPPKPQLPPQELEKELEYLYLRRLLVENLIRHLEEYASARPSRTLRPTKVA